MTSVEAITLPLSIKGVAGLMYKFPNDNIVVFNRDVLDNIKKSSICLLNISDGKQPATGTVLTIVPNDDRRTYVQFLYNGSDFGIRRGSIGSELWSNWKML